MDTKLKNSKGARNTGFLIVMLATVIFMSLYSHFRVQADKYCGQEGGNAFESDEFLEILFSCNLVFYKDVLDKSGVEYTTEDLYVDISEEKVQQVHVDDYAGKGQKLYSSEEAVREIYEEQIDEELVSLRQNYANQIGKRMDYCVVEKSTETILKNTSKNIEQLAGEQGEAGETSYYDYYIVLEYGENGSLANIRVKGQNPEQFLRTARVVSSGNSSVLLSGRSETENYAVVNPETDIVEKELTFKQIRPKNAIFIYAMTEDQMTAFESKEQYEYNMLSSTVFEESEYVYYMVGVGNVYMLFLAIIAILVLVLAIARPVLLWEAKSKKLSIEVLVLVGIFLLCAGQSMVVGNVNYTNQGGYAAWVNRNLPILSGFFSRELLANVVNFCFLAFLFGTWYWCLLGLKDIGNGLVPYLKEHSLIYRYWRQIVDFGKKLYRNFKKEVLDADLGKDNKKLLMKVVIINFAVLAIICCFWTIGIPILIIYSFLLYGLLKNYIFKIQWQYRKMLEATNSIAEGKLNNTFEENFGLFESYKAELYKIQDGFSKAVEEEVKSQRMKTELITNVSHDLKTPLTAIITYIDLLKQENITEEQRKEYIDTLERKSLRLKVLIEDLFEVSKANSGNVKIEPMPVDICNLLRQVYLEHEEKMKQAGFDVRFELPEEKVILQLDSQKTYRIFENLYVNIIKYALPGTRVWVQAVPREGNDGDAGTGIHIEMKNMSAQEIHINPQDLTERFVRGDASRNTEGSGLGLAIAKSFTELQGGTFRVETDGDLFKVIIEW